MTEIENLEDKVMSIKDGVDNNNQETTKSPIHNLTFYHSVPTDEVSTLLNHPVESNELLASFKSIVQESNFYLLAPSQLVNLLTEDFVGKNLIKL